MSAPKTIQVKLYSIQIRRFSILPSINFKTFQNFALCKHFDTEKVTEIPKGIVFKYLDEESDWVTLSSEEEWKQAILIVLQKKSKKILKVKICQNNTQSNHSGGNYDYSRWKMNEFKKWNMFLTMLGNVIVNAGGADVFCQLIKEWFPHLCEQKQCEKSETVKKEEVKDDSIPEKMKDDIPVEPVSNKEVPKESEPKSQTTEKTVPTESNPLKDPFSFFEFFNRQCRGRGRGRGRSRGRWRRFFGGRGRGRGRFPNWMMGGRGRGRSGFGNFWRQMHMMKQQMHNQKKKMNGFPQNVDINMQRGMYNSMSRSRGVPNVSNVRNQQKINSKKKVEPNAPDFENDNELYSSDEETSGESDHDENENENENENEKVEVEINFEKELVSLEEMGFIDRKKNLVLLKKYSGDISSVCNELFNK